MIIRRVCRPRLAFPPHLSARFSEQPDKRRQLEERLREVERQSINNSVTQVDPSFSTLGKAVKVGKRRLLLFKAVLVGGLLIALVFESIELRAHPLTQQRQVALKQAVALSQAEASEAVEGIPGAGQDGAAGAAARRAVPEFPGDLGEPD